MELPEPHRRAPAPGRPPPLKLGPLTVSPPVILAPMSGLTTLSMRTLSEEAGCGLTITEFIAAPALAARVPKEVEKLQPSRGGRPFGVQIFGRDPEQMGRAAAMAADVGADWIDLNMGCPARKVTKGVAGAALMREPDLAEALIRSVVEATAGRSVVTAKIRSGWDDAHRNAPEFAARMVAAGAQAITIHGRTRMQGFKGVASLEDIARVKQAVDVPVIGNGDVTDVPAIERMFEITGCDGVMVGRAALGNPWIFTLFERWWEGAPLPAPPTPADRLAMYLNHLELYLEHNPPQRAVLEMRKFASWYIRGFPGASGLRKSIYHTAETDTVRQIVTDAMA